MKLRSFIGYLGLGFFANFIREVVARHDFKSEWEWEWDGFVTWKITYLPEGMIRLEETDHNVFSDPHWPPNVRSERESRLKPESEWQGWRTYAGNDKRGLHRNLNKLNGRPSDSPPLYPRIRKRLTGNAKSS